MLYFPIIVSLFSLLFVFFLIKQIQKVPFGEGLTIKLSQAIKEGAEAFLKRQYRTAALVAISLFFILWLVFGFKSGLAFLIGVMASAAAGFVGMTVSLQNDLKVVEAAKTGLKKALELSFKSGSVAGFSVVGSGLLVVSIFYLLTNDLRALIFLGFGGSLTSVFFRIGGGIYAKAVNVGLDLVSKTEEGTFKKDVKNPAVIANQVGENISGGVGMAADLFETYVVALISAMILAGVLFSRDSPLVFLPILLGTTAILASIIGSFFVSLGKDQNIMAAVYRGLAVSVLMAAVGFYPVIKKITSSISLSIPEAPGGRLISGNKIYLASLVGLIMIVGIFMITEYFISKKRKPVKMIVSASQSGHERNIVIAKRSFDILSHQLTIGLAVAMQATILPGILISLGILASFWLAGIYGVALAAMAMLSLVGIIISINALGLADGNVGNIAEISEAGEDIKKVIDTLDAVGKTTKAVTNGYAITSAGLTALVLFASFSQELLAAGARFNFSLEDPKVLAGLFLGGLIPYLFASLVMTAKGKAAGEVVKEVRRQFKEIPGLMEGAAKPDYGKCVDIVTKAALKEMIVPALIPVLAPLVIGFLLGPLALAGVLVGSILTGMFLAISMTSGGAAWDNAKKYIEEGNYGGKGSFALQAAMTGDTVGDPYKDTAGLAINPMIKVMNIVALLIVGFLV